MKKIRIINPSGKPNLTYTQQLELKLKKMLTQYHGRQTDGTRRLQAEIDQCNENNRINAERSAQYGLTAKSQNPEGLAGKK